MATEEDLSLFDLGNITVQEIRADDDEEAKQYMVKMYERIRRLEKPTPTEMVSEVSTSASEKEKSVSLTFEDDSFDEVFPEVKDVRDNMPFQIRGETISVPIFKNKKQLKQWIKVLDHHEARLLNIMFKVERITDITHIKQEMDAIKIEVRQLDLAKLKDKSKIDAIRRTLNVARAEELVLREIGSLGQVFQDLFGVIDPVTDGLWLQENEKNERLQGILQKIGTRRIVFNSRQVVTGDRM